MLLSPLLLYPDLILERLLSIFLTHISSQTLSLEWSRGVGTLRRSAFYLVARVCQQSAFGDRITLAITQDQFMPPQPLVSNGKDHKEGANPPLRATCQAKSAPYSIFYWIMAKVVGKVAP